MVQPYESTTTSVVSKAVASLEQVSKHYGNVQALKEVNLAIQPGEVVAILGPNGAGKTTAVNLMLGLLKPTSGQVELFGNGPTRRTEPDAYRGDVADFRGAGNLEGG